MKKLKSIFFTIAVMLSCVSCVLKSNDKQETKSNYVLTLDTCLQSLADVTLKNHSGCIVAIEPNTGEIKCMSSSSTSDYNVQSFEFAPGQVYQPIQAMIALEEGVIDSTSLLPAQFVMGGFRLDCRSSIGSANLSKAMEQTNEAYFAHCFVRTLNNKRYADVQSAYATWIEYARTMGLGKPMGIDMNNEASGLIPSGADYARIFRTTKWKPINVIREGIGRGDIRVTPLQIANLAAIIANRGYYLTPHITLCEGKENSKNQSRISPEVYDMMADLMKREVKGGTDYCCFGGTLVNTDDAYTVSMGYYPAENPRIAFCCYLDNKGRGGLDSSLLLAMLVDHYEKSIEK